MVHSPEIPATAREYRLHKVPLALSSFTKYEFNKFNTLDNRLS